MFHIIDPRPVEPMSLAEAQRILSDLDFAMRFDPFTRMLAFRVCHAARRGQCCPVLVLVAGASTPTTEPPKDAA